MHVGGRCTHQINREKRLTLRAVCRIKHMHDKKKKTLCDDNESVCLGTSSLLPFFFSRGNKKTKTSVGGATGRRQLRQETQTGGLAKKTQQISAQKHGTQ